MHSAGREICFVDDGRTCDEKATGCAPSARRPLVVHHLQRVADQPRAVEYPERQIRLELVAASCPQHPLSFELIIRVANPRRIGQPHRPAVDRRLGGQHIAGRPRLVEDDRPLIADGARS